MADLVAHDTAGNRAHGGACAALGLLDRDLLVAADLARHGHLLDDRRGGKHAADFLRLGHAHGAETGQGEEESLFHENLAGFATDGESLGTRNQCCLTEA